MNKPSNFTDIVLGKKDRDDGDRIRGRATKTRKPCPNFRLPGRDFVIAILARCGFLLLTTNPQTMTAEEILFDAEVAMEKSVDYMVHEFSSVRTGKASPALVENVDVEAYGSAMKLKQLALITTPEPRLLVVQPFDAATVKDIEKALKESKIGIMPLVDGKIIRLPIPGAFRRATERIS